MKRHHAWLFVLYGAAVIGFSIYQYSTYQSEFQRVVPYVHDTAVPVTAVTTATSAPAVTTAATAGTTAASSTETAIQYPLELNLATAAQLCTLPGIGETRAQEIIAYRTKIGGFRYLAQLMEVPGIGEGIFAGVRPYLYLTDEFPPETTAAATAMTTVTTTATTTTTVTTAAAETTETTAVTETGPETETETVPIPMLNLNKVTKEELLLLPGCDETLADNILYLRDKQIHFFHNILELNYAEGVTPELYVQWEPYLMVDDDGRTMIPMR